MTDCIWILSVRMPRIASIWLLSFLFSILVAVSTLAALMIARCPTPLNLLDTRCSFSNYSLQLSSLVRLSIVLPLILRPLERGGSRCSRLVHAAILPDPVYFASPPTIPCFSPYSFSLRLNFQRSLIFRYPAFASCLHCALRLLSLHPPYPRYRSIPSLDSSPPSDRTSFRLTML